MIVNDTVTIDGKDYRLGLSLRVHVIYERITGKPVDGNMQTMGTVVLLYSILVAFNRDTFRMTFDEMFDYLDKHPDVYQDLVKWVCDYGSRGIPEKEENPTGDKKKG